MFSIRGRIHHFFGVVLLATLWVTSLASLSSRATATSVLTEIGVNVLNPYLASNSFGLAEKAYGGLQAAATAHPNDALPLAFLKIQVKGNDIAGLNFADGSRVIYSKVAQGYYDNGPTSVFNLPPDLSKAIDTYGLFLATGSTPQDLPSGVNLPHLPNVLQPFFIATGLSPYTLTAQGHNRIMTYLLWFWVATLILGALTILLDNRPYRQRIANLFQGAFGGALPTVVIIAGVWAFATFKAQAASPYMGMLRLVTSAFLPVYGGALAVSALALILLRVLPMFFSRRAEPAPALRQPAPVGAPAPQRMYQPHAYNQPNDYPPSAYPQPQPNMYGQPQYGAPNAYAPRAGYPAPDNGYPPAAPDAMSPYQQDRYPYSRNASYPPAPQPQPQLQSPDPWSSSPDAPTMP